MLIYPVNLHVAKEWVVDRIPDHEHDLSELEPAWWDVVDVEKNLKFKTTDLLLFEPENTLWLLWGTTLMASIFWRQAESNKP